MGLWSKIKEIFGFTKQKEKIKLFITCGHCSQEFDSVFRRNYDFQPSYGQEDFAYAVDKKLVCPGCYKSLHLELKLNKNLEILDQKLDNGELKVAEEDQD